MISVLECNTRVVGTNKDCQKLKLSDGSKVAVKKEFRCTLPKDEEKRAQCYKWLRDQGLGDIIKNKTLCASIKCIGKIVE